MAGESVVPLPPRRPHLRPAEERFADVSNSMDALRVDGADLAVISRYLDSVAQLARIVHQTVHSADRAAQIDGSPSGHRYGSLGHVDIGGVTAIGDRLAGTVRAVQGNLTEFATAVDRTAEAVTKLARRYQSIDERNKLDAEQVRKYLKS